LTQTRTQAHILDVTKNGTPFVGRLVLDSVILHAERFVLTRVLTSCNGVIKNPEAGLQAHPTKVSMNVPPRANKIQARPVSQSRKPLSVSRFVWESRLTMI
jgi:hypothetical protein